VKKLLIDAGNTSIKWSLLDNGELSNMQRRAYSDISPIRVLEELLETQCKTSGVDTIIMVSVLGDKHLQVVKELASRLSLNFIHAKPAIQLAGVINAYKEHHKLGADRLVAMIAAHHLNKGQASIIVDSGTATTIDAVDAQGQHLGGVILSGLDLCSSSLLENTKMLATFNEGKNEIEENVFSTDTKQAIASGSLFGLAGAIESICTKMEGKIKQKLKEEVIINKFICGGSATKLQPYLSAEFQHNEDLIMQGLKVISDIDTASNSGKLN
jgi:type III pantothenate kinase